MPVDYKSVSRKLKQARELQSLPFTTVSESTGIDVERIKGIEAGNFKVSGDEVLILANYYRHDFRDFLDEDRPEPFEQTDILYRRHGTAFNAADRRAIQEFIYLCEFESYLEKELGVNAKNFSFQPKGTFFKAHGENAAGKLRVFLDYATNETPRDVYSDFRKLGFHIFRRKLNNPEISGLYIEHPTAGHCILVNYDEDIYRQRFSVCHEAAHVIFDSSEGVLISYRKDSTKYDQSDLKEIRANRFASCYLLPPSQLPVVSQWNESLARQWAQKLRVSTFSLSIALQQASLVDKSTAAMIRSTRVDASEKIDPEAPEHLTDTQRLRRISLLERGLSDSYVGLCFEAYYQDLISAGRLSEGLLADHAETSEISVLYGRAIKHGA